MTAHTAAGQTDHLPAIDYTRHPIYGRSAAHPGMLARLVGYGRYVWVLGYLISLRCYHFITRRRWIETGATPQLDTLRSDGIVQMQLRTGARNDISRAAQEYFDRLAARRETIARGQRSYSDGQLDTTRADAPELFAAVEHALTDAGILASVRAYLGHRADVRKITMQMNDEWDSFWRHHFESRGLPLPDTAFFHVDNTYGVVKVIVYMSDVTEASGPFSYVPGTNRIPLSGIEGLLLRATDIWLDMWPQNGALLLSLPRAFRRRAKFGDDIPAGDESGRRLLAHEHVATSANGDLLLFDVMGIHRGGLVKQGERRILQIMMR